MDHRNGHLATLDHDLRTSAYPRQQSREVARSLRVLQMVVFPALILISESAENEIYCDLGFHFDGRTLK